MNEAQSTDAEPTPAKGDILMLAALLDRMVAGHRAVAAQVLRGVGATEAVAGLIWLLARPDVDSRLGSLAQRLACDPSNVTLLASQLERLGLAKRVPDDKDGRQKRLQMTPAGERVAELLLHEVASSSPLSGLTAAERSRLEQILTDSEK
jgi:MarR family transcriptional regulator, organic hydroperoxide resistance regulator